MENSISALPRSSFNESASRFEKHEQGRSDFAAALQAACISLTPP